METEKPLVRWNAQSKRSTSKDQHDTLDLRNLRNPDTVRMRCACVESLFHFTILRYYVTERSSLANQIY